jgi:hypothetical protein
VRYAFLWTNRAKQRGQSGAGFIPSLDYRRAQVAITENTLYATKTSVKRAQPPTCETPETGLPLLSAAQCRVRRGPPRSYVRRQQKGLKLWSLPEGRSGPSFARSIMWRRFAAFVQLNARWRATDLRRLHPTYPVSSPRRNPRFDQPQLRVVSTDPKAVSYRWLERRNRAWFWVMLLGVLFGGLLLFFTDWLSR